MTQDTTPQTCTTTTTTTIIDEEVEQEEQEDCTDAASSEKDSTPWHLFGTVCPKEESFSVSGRRLVHGHPDQHLQPDERSR